MATTKVVDMAATSSSAIPYDDYFYKTTPTTDERTQASIVRDYAVSYTHLTLPTILLV